MKTSVTDYKFNNILESGYPNQTDKESKLRFIPVAYKAAKHENDKRSDSPIKLKPACYFGDYGEMGVSGLFSNYRRKCCKCIFLFFLSCN